MNLFDKLHELVTEADNVTLCPVRVSALVVSTVYHSAAVFGLVMHSFTVDMVALGQYINQMSVLIGTMGVGVGAKAIMKADAPKS